MEDLGSILPKAFRKDVFRGDKPALQILIPLWPRVVGKIISRVSEPVAFEGGALTIAASSPTWTAQLKGMSDPLQAQINKFLGSRVVTKLRIRQGIPQVRRLESSTAMIERSRSRRAIAPQVEPPPGLAKLLWAQEEVKLSPELMEVVERSFIKYFSRNRKLESV